MAESQRVAETEEMQATIDRLTAELVQQRGAVAVAGDKALAAEGKMHDVVEQLNRKIAEVQVRSQAYHTCCLINDCGFHIFRQYSFLHISPVYTQSNFRIS